MTFTDSPDWSGNTSQAAENWNKWLVNFETHTIALSEESIAEFGYEPGLYDTKHSERFGISMFHQLHCLVSLSPIFSFTSISLLLFFSFSLD